MYLPGRMTAWSMSPIPQRCAQQLDYVPRRRASPLSHRPRGHQRVIRSARKGCSGKPAAKAHTPTWVIIGRAAIVVQRDGENRAFAWGGNRRILPDAPITLAAPLYQSMHCELATVFPNPLELMLAFGVGHAFLQQHRASGFEFLLRLC
jgi:hypothetical protein